MWQVHQSYCGFAPSCGTHTCGTHTCETHTRTGPCKIRVQLTGQGEARGWWRNMVQDDQRYRVSTLYAIWPWKVAWQIRLHVNRYSHDDMHRTEHRARSPFLCTFQFFQPILNDVLCHAQAQCKEGPVFISVCLEQEVFLTEDIVQVGKFVSHSFHWCSVMW